MVRMLGISDATVHRRLKDFNLQTSHSFSTVDDNTLDGIVRSIKEEFPNSGFRMVCGHLKGRGYVIQQIRVRESLRRIDLEDTILRWLHVTERRKYNVSSPNALWHIDGHHKLMRLVSRNYQNFVQAFLEHQCTQLRVEGKVLFGLVDYKGIKTMFPRVVYKVHWLIVALICAEYLMQSQKKRGKAGNKFAPRELLWDCLGRQIRNISFVCKKIISCALKDLAFD